MRHLTFIAMILSAKAAMAQPNVLLVIADDMGLNASPCHTQGSDMVKMPTLAGLCAQGMVFENAYAAPTCSPSRATMMTGRYGARTEIGGVLTRDNPGALDDDEETLFDLMNAQGYANALIGKWHLTSNGRDYTHPGRLGVSHYFGLFSGGVQDYRDWTAIEDGTPVAMTTYTTTALTDRAVDWVGAQDDPWFLWLAYNAPHTPFHAPPEALHDAADLPPDPASIRANPGRYYFAALQALDTELGRLLGTLDRQERENTVVIFVGDNGTPARAIGRDARGRLKGSLYEGGVNVPLVIAGPSVMPGRSEALANTTDLFATILDLASGRSDAEDSISLTPILTGKTGDRTHAYVEQFSQAEPRGAGRLGWAIRDARYKLLQLDGRDPLLFDLQSDPAEETNLLDGRLPGMQRIADELASAKNDLLRVRTP